MECNQTNKFGQLEYTLLSLAWHNQCQHGKRNQEQICREEQRQHGQARNQCHQQQYGQHRQHKQQHGQHRQHKQDGEQQQVCRNNHQWGGQHHKQEKERPNPSDRDPGQSDPFQPKRVSTRPRDSPVRIFDSMADRSKLSSFIGTKGSRSCVWLLVLSLYPSHTCEVNSSVLEYRHRCPKQGMFHPKYALFRRSRRRSEKQICKPPSPQRPQRWASTAPSAAGPNKTTA